jgi:hypothetical protein
MKYLLHPTFIYSFLIILFIFGFYSLRVINIDGQGVYLDPSLMILYFTLLAIVIYSYETYRLRKITARQVGVQIRPYLVIKWDPNLKQGKKTGFKIMNIGRGIAKNIYIDDITFNTNILKKNINLT